MGCEFTSYFLSPHTFQPCMVVYEAVTQKSVIGTMPKSMFSSKMESYRAAGDGRVARSALGNRNWLLLVHVEGKGALFSSVMMK
jgi:hypothetical protein